MCKSLSIFHNWLLSPVLDCPNEANMKLALLPWLDFLHHMHVTSGSGAHAQDRTMRNSLCWRWVEPVWLRMQTWYSTSRLESPFGLVYPPVSLERSSLSVLAKSEPWLAVLVIYSKKPKSFMYWGKWQRSSLKRFWSPPCPVSRHVDSCNDTFQLKYSFQKLRVNCFITNCQEKRVYVCWPPPRICTRRLACPPHPLAAAVGCSECWGSLYNGRAHL